MKIERFEIKIAVASVPSRGDESDLAALLGIIPDEISRVAPRVPLSFLEWLGSLEDSRE